MHDPLWLNKVSAFFAYLNDIHLMNYDEAEANEIKQGEKLPCKSRVINCWVVLLFEESSSLASEWGPDSMKYMHMISREKDQSKVVVVVQICNIFFLIEIDHPSLVWNFSENSSFFVRATRSLSTIWFSQN